MADLPTFPNCLIMRMPAFEMKHLKMKLLGNLMTNILSEKFQSLMVIVSSFLKCVLFLPFMSEHFCILSEICKLQHFLL